jgi:rare lipoprotein A (peptidoglycan hydrolase)
MRNKNWISKIVLLCCWNLPVFFLPVYGEEPSGNLCATNDSVLSVFSGKASFYAVKFQGRKTSNGERLDNNAYTCAHSYLPFDTYVRVTNKRNGKSVVVRVTDRFPPRGDHLVDLTRQAAMDIDMIAEGRTRVKLEVLRPDIGRKYSVRDTVSFKLFAPAWKLNLPVPIFVCPPVPE